MSNNFLSFYKEKNIDIITKSVVLDSEAGYVGG